MSFVGDKLYNGYLRPKMAIIVTRVNPMEIMIHLPCLTDHDRESIVVKTETRGKFDGMRCLLDCLKRREHWPEQFIDAMERCEQQTIADELRAEYNALQGINNSSSLPTTLVRAHVHPVPSVSQQSIQSDVTPGAPTEPAASAPPLLVVPVEPPSCQRAGEPQQCAPTDVPPPPLTPPLATEPQQSAATEVPPPPLTPPPASEPQKSATTESPPPPLRPPQAAEPQQSAPTEVPPPPLTPPLAAEPQQSAPTEVPPPPLTPPLAAEPQQSAPTEVPPPPLTPPLAAEPQQSAPTEVPPPPLTPPLAAEPQQSAPTEVPLPSLTPPPSLGQASTTKMESNSHQEPEENSESLIYDVTPDLTDPGNGNAVALEHLMKASETKDVSEVADLQPAATTEESSPRCSTPVEEISDVTATPEKPPIQETCPLDKIPAVVTQPEETIEPPITQEIKGGNGSSSPALGEATVTAKHDPSITVIKKSPQRETTETAEADTFACLSDESTVCLSKPTELVSIHSQNLLNTTFSIDSHPLEISECVRPALVPSCSTVSPPVVDSDKILQCQENGIASTHDDSDENPYESSCESLETQEVLTNVVRVSEEPSLLNLDVQTSATHTQIVNGEVTKEATPFSTDAADELVLNLNAATSCQACDSAPELQKTPNSEEKPALVTAVAHSSNTKYITTAVGVLACALLVAWRFKN